MGDRIKIVVVDTDHRRRAALALVLTDDAILAEPHDGLGDIDLVREREAMFLVCDEAGLLEDFQTLARQQGLRPVHAAYAETPVLQRATAAVRGGACDYLAWPVTARMVHAALQIGATQRTRVAVRTGPDNEAVRRLRLLSDRERQVLVAVGQAIPNREIAAMLGISHRTVEVHRTNILNKLGLENTRDAARLLVEAEFADPAAGHLGEVRDAERRRPRAKRPTTTPER